jgi:crossover junction endodeoxyribonuclease RuvC
MIVLGIDPGTKRIGYGLVKKDGPHFTCLDAGILKVSSSEQKLILQEAKQGLSEVIKKYDPQLLAIERLYFAKNKKTALSVAEARGVILLSAAEYGIPVIEYAPNAVKLGVAGYGNADKKAVWKMVQLTLKLQGNLIDDASDALALAIMGCGERLV